jgi:hypothetical protein
MQPRRRPAGLLLANALWAELMRRRPLTAKQPAHEDKNTHGGSYILENVLVEVGQKEAGEDKGHSDPDHENLKKIDPEHGPICHDEF